MKNKDFCEIEVKKYKNMFIVNIYKKLKS